MPEHGSYTEYFEDALRIHAICADMSLSDNDARLLTYMHAKSSQCSDGVEYFRHPAREDTDALEIMLGKRSGSLRLPAVMSLDKSGQEAIEMILTIAERINRLDALLARECGMENRLSSELRYRLKLYKEYDFRERMIQLYNKVHPQIAQYDRARINTAFRRSREEQQRAERELMEMAGIKN